LTGSPLAADDQRLMASGGARHEPGVARCDGRWRELEDASAPYAAAVTTAEKKPELLDPRPATAHAPWVRPLSCYERRETTVVEGLRYG
jgi:hypothetical protein